MQRLITILFKGIRYLHSFFIKKIDWYCTFFLLYCNNIQFKSIQSNGIPYVSVARGSTCTISDNFRMNNGLKGNPIGRPQRCVFFVDHGAELHIGKNVGMSSTALVAHQKITIGNNVKLGGGVCIYDTDFHALNPVLRKNAELDRKYKNNEPVTIEDNAFIGAHTTILKGVTIGDNAIIGACSLITKDVPSNEIWGGNPAKFIKKVNQV